MILGIYCVRDAKVGFATPTVDSNDASAMRNFSFALSDRQNSVMSFSKADFDLYKLGTFDTFTGEILTQNPVIVISGSSVMEVLPY